MLKGILIFKSGQFMIKKSYLLFSQTKICGKYDACNGSRISKAILKRIKLEVLHYLTSRLLLS